MTKFLNFFNRVPSTNAIKSCKPGTIIELGMKVDGIVVEKVKIILAFCYLLGKTKFFMASCVLQWCSTVSKCFFSTFSTECKSLLNL